ncbi:MAG: SUMF1/EgtB/PvdO family nonheme iron enzyme [Myxococcota bacterium]|nr:SUMF1/EgtB/PvdO family nonheme iron enzyme [Myxococcota bacterium]
MRRSVHYRILLMIVGVCPMSHANELDTGTSSCLPVSVAGMSCIPGGTFIRGSEADRTCMQGEVRRIPAKKPNHRPVSTITLKTFYMDQTEVTYAAYQACVKTGACRRRRPAYNDYSRPQQPMVGLTWYEAHNYCKAMGKHLPTEAEWEKAARGDTGELYPWGNQPADCKRAVIKDKKGRSCGVRKKAPSPHKGRTLVVKSRPAGRYGLYDMIGNAEEWTADWYSKDWATCGESCGGHDPKGPCGDQEPSKKCAGYTKKVVRGGSWYWPENCATSWTRRPHFPRNKPYHHFGFRCSASLEEAKALVLKSKL